jgi:LysR family nod box-dependent transcriptional activator
MHLNKLDLNLLVALHALLVEQNVSRAAERLHVSQPAMSGSLQRLRAYLNDPLLESAGHHRLKLTPRARRLAGPVKDLLNQIQNTLSAQPDFDPSTAEQDVHIAMSDYCAHVFGCRLIADVGRNAPKIKIRIHPLTENAIAAVNNGDIDFCMTLPQRTYLDPCSQYMQLRAETTFKDRFVIVAAEKNAEIAKSLTLDKYRALPSVEIRLIGDSLSIPERMLACYDKPANTVAVVSGFHLALAAVSGTSMVAIVPVMLAEALAKSLELKWYEPAFELPELTETLIWHERNEADASYIWIRERIKAVASAFTRESPNKREGARLSVIS